MQNRSGGGGAAAAVRAVGRQARVIVCRLRWSGHVGPAAGLITACGLIDYVSPAFLPSLSPAFCLCRWQQGTNSSLTATTTHNIPPYYPSPSLYSFNSARRVRTLREEKSSGSVTLEEANCSLEVKRKWRDKGFRFTTRSPRCPPSTSRSRHILYTRARLRCTMVHVCMY